jgi:hypothetical protein
MKKLEHAPLSRVLTKIFAAGFYQVHSGTLLVAFIILVGAVPPGQLLFYHRALMLAFVSSPLMMGIVFILWLAYLFKSWHYVAGKLFAPGQLFLFYSAGAYTHQQLIKSWALVQSIILLPMIIYGGMAAVLGVANRLYLGPLVVVSFLTAMVYISAAFHTTMINRLMENCSTSRLLLITAKWKKPFFSLFIYQVFDQLKLTWLITKGLSWLIITGVFAVFSDVRHDARVAGIAMLAVVTAHAVLIFEDRRFGETRLSFGRNIPFARSALFAGDALVYFALLLPENIWLFTRFEPVLALQLLLFGITAALLLKSLLYRIGLDMEVYLQWVLGLFIVLFWIVMFKLLWLLGVINLWVAFALFYNSYYREAALKQKAE